MVLHRLHRVILETPAVRAASVSALAKFAGLCPPLRQSIKVLLQRCDWHSPCD